ncbi:MAG: hypothetical protein ACXWCB_16475 [Acidimicrobiales bacterium]
MTIDERARHELFITAERSLGHDQSETLMELLPPVGWADVATKADLVALEERLSLRFEMVDQRFEMVGQRFEMVDQRFEMLDQRLDQRFEMLDQRLDQRFEMLDQRLDHRFEMVDQKIDAQSISLLGELDRRFNAQTRTLFLSLAGLMISLTTVLLAVR